MKRKENGILVNISKDKLASPLPSLFERKIRKRPANSSSLKVTAIYFLVDEYQGKEGLKMKNFHDSDFNGIQGI